MKLLKLKSNQAGFIPLLLALLIMLALGVIYAYLRVSKAAH